MRAEATPPIVITAGEPAGIGPDLCIQLAQQAQPQAPLVIADPRLLQARAALLGLPLTIRPYQADEPAPSTAPGELWLLALEAPGSLEPGQPDPANAAYLLAGLRRAAQGCLSGEFAALVTGPLHKAVINEAGVPFSGHTEYLAELAGVEQVVMMLATETPVTGGDTLRVALLTTHLPLREVADALTAERLQRVLSILDHDLRTRFGIVAPRIKVCGLNPHAGEGGHLGREEQEIIEPTLERLREQGLKLDGPLPADTLFTPHGLQGADAVLAMYHDQGLPVLKHLGFGHAVNITLGLPFIRTSVDHGTALELAGSGRASGGSLAYAIETARRMARASQSTES